MIVGNGLLAKAFSSFEIPAKTCIFASGVSNSSETEPAEFSRERTLLESKLGLNEKLIYFSSCTLANVPYLDSPYFAHKRQMEQLVHQSNPINRIFRLPQVVGRTENRFTLTNFLNDRIRNEESFTVWSEAERNLIDVDDVVNITLWLLDHPTDSRTINIASLTSLKMPEIVGIFERVLRKKARYNLVAKGEPLQVSCHEALLASNDLNIDLGNDYAERTIRKYYSEA